jgi:anaphase-promoting complex subunit 8
MSRATYKKAGLDKTTSPAGYEKSLDAMLESYPNSEIVKSLSAITAYNNRGLNTISYLSEFAEAARIFKEIYADDPDSLDHMDIYSNTLYCLDDQETDLAFLAQECHMKDEFRLECCCVLANYFSKSGDSEKSIMYLERVLKIDPSYNSAWTLIGHEHLEIKDHNSAIESYRKAIAGNKNDYRAWYGLGQAYEVLGMPLYSQQYYKDAILLRPGDSRLWTSLGKVYSEVKEYAQAIRAYKRALVIFESEVTEDGKEVEGCIQTLYDIGRAYQTMEEYESAAFYYKLAVAERVEGYRGIQKEACDWLVTWFSQGQVEDGEEGVGQRDYEEGKYYEKESEYM